jgi:hypothetical protein
MRGRYSAMTLALASLLPLASSHAADTKLVKAVSDHFELYTTDNDAAAKAALTHFETVRGYLLKSMRAADPFTAPVRIFGFKATAEYEFYVPKGGDLTSKAFSATAGDRVVIGMSSLKKDDYQFGVREYAALLLARLDPKMPYWLKLGLSELYSTLRPEEGTIAMGEEPMRSFHSEVSSDLDMQVMFALKGGISRNKGAEQFYGDNSQTGIANSKAGAKMANMEGTTTVDYPMVLWQLTHMLMFKKEYSPKFGALVGALNDQNTVSAIQQVFGQSLEGLKYDLMLYIQMPSHEVLHLKYQLDSPVKPQVSQLSPADSAPVLAELKTAK